MMDVMIPLITLVAGIFISWILFRNNSKQNKNDSTADMQQLLTRNAVTTAELEKSMADIKDLQHQLTSLRAEYQQLLTDNAKLQSTLDFSNEKLQTQKQEIESIGQKLESQFKMLASSILEEKAQKFSEQQEGNLKIMLDPLKQQLHTFKQDFETRYNDESKERISLKEQIRHMMELNKTLSDQANNLTEALRGQVKQQGNWGEMILESILEYSGLQKNIQYFLQERGQNAEGQIIQPDVIVRYPDNRAIVIDSKVSLVHYESYCATDDSTQRMQYLDLMMRSFRAHIDGLSAKSYQDVTHALDFVLMFIPVEAAYITVMQADNTLWQYAYNKRILLLSPTNLIAAMKLVNDMWQRDTINKDAHKIAEKAGKLYDKLVGFVENFERVGNQIDRAQNAWQDAYKQLSKGKGNLISQAEQMKQFKAAATKTLPLAIVDQALVEDGLAATTEDEVAEK